ncbi:hypothetical protein BDZ89DRAFT_1164620 [Hymenopellis radicata]|nr:hypothetical protein BDZ89DRAFT_1164620 [Hymenopellis radicata]
MSASKTSSTTSYSRSGSPASTSFSTTWKPPSLRLLRTTTTPSITPDPRVLQRPATKHRSRGPTMGLPVYSACHRPGCSTRGLKRSLPPVKFMTLAKGMGHPHKLGTLGEAARPASIQWDADILFMSQRPSGNVDERFVVNSGAAFGVEGYDDICCRAHKRNADEDVEMSDADTEPVVEETNKKQKVDKSPSRCRTRKTTTPSAGPAKRATPKPVSRKAPPKPASRKSTPTAASKSNPRPQTSQKSAAAGPSASIPVRQTRWTTEAEKTIMMEA